MIRERMVGRGGCAAPERMRNGALVQFPRWERTMSRWLWPSSVLIPGPLSPAAEKACRKVSTRRRRDGAGPGGLGGRMNPRQRSTKSAPGAQRRDTPIPAVDEPGRERETEGETLPLSIGRRGPLHCRLPRHLPAAARPEGPNPDGANDGTGRTAAEGRLRLGKPAPARGRRLADARPALRLPGAGGRRFPRAVAVRSRARDLVGRAGRAGALHPVSAAPRLPDVAADRPQDLGAPGRLRARPDPRGEPHARGRPRPEVWPARRHPG